MRLTTKGRYGVRAVVNLAGQNQNGPVSISKISREEDLSPEFLEQIFFKLKKSGVIRSIRGPKGGFLLNSNPSDVTIKMILDARKPSEDKRLPIDPTRGLSLVLLSVATSIDAFAAGLSLALLGTEIFMAAAVIGVVACIMTLVGMRFGSILGKKVGSRAEVFGGLVLILLGIKILLEQLAG